MMMRIQITFKFNETIEQKVNSKLQFSSFKKISVKFGVDINQNGFTSSPKALAWATKTVKMISIDYKFKTYSIFIKRKLIIVKKN